MKVAVLVALLVTVGQVLPSCDGGGGGQEVIGWVEERYIHRVPMRVRYVIVINAVHHEVPFPFWHNVEVGDLVKYDGFAWTIVRKSGT